MLAPLFAPAKNGGGPIRTLQALVAEAPPDFSVHVLTGDRDLGAEARLPVEFDSWQTIPGAQVYYASAGVPRLLIRGFRALRDTGPAVLYFNGFFDPRFSIVPQLLWRCGFWRGTPRLLAPRGEFGEGALHRRQFKKRAYIALYRALRLHKDLYWHASNEAEAEAIRAVWGRGAEILVRENETLLPLSADRPERENETLERPLRVVFLGRLVEHKGLHIALEALLSQTKPIDFDVYGPEEDAAYASRCRAIAEKAPTHVTVRFRGPVEPEDVRATLSHYDLVLMPTAGENFGHVIAEALSVSCPVYCSPHTPWTSTLEHGAGAAIPLTIEDWAHAIGASVEQTAAQRHQSRLRAGDAFDRWRSEPKAAHVFELLDARLARGADLRGGLRRRR